MTVELEAAWLVALDAPPADQGPWRVLADMLGAAGDPRGEWMQLELDAELGPLRGLARGRRDQLSRELPPQFLPKGLPLKGVRFERAVLTACTQAPGAAVAADDARWRTVRRLTFLPAPNAPPASLWQRTALGGGRLERLAALSGVEQEAMEVLANGPGLPRLKHLELLGEVGRPPNSPVANWQRWWPLVFARQPLLKEVQLGWSGLDAVTRARLEGVRAAPLERVGLDSGPDQLFELHGWVLEAQPAWEFIIRPRSVSLAGAEVALGRRELTLRCTPAQVSTLEGQLRSAWLGRGALPPLRVEGPRLLPW